MITLATLFNTHRPRKKVQRVGRGVGSKRGKTACRGTKGDKSRRGYKQHLGKEGGQLPLYRKLPTKGFSNARFKNSVFSISLERINELFSDGDVVNMHNLRAMGYGNSVRSNYLKILSNGELLKKVTIQASAYSKNTIHKLQHAQIPFSIVR